MTSETAHTTALPWVTTDWIIIISIAVFATMMLFANLDDKYLWQDEAATAVMAERMMRYGKPLAYDGKNLITMDNFAEEDQQTIGLRTGSAHAALRYFIDRRDFKADTAWTGQPWGQFLVAGISLSLFGHNTFAARVPFSAAAVITVLLLYLFVRKLFQDRLTGVLAASLLLFNTYWILHSRQCRYYSLTSLMLLVTVMVYTYWQRGGRFGGLSFIVAAWIWFQVDFGTFWPVIGILLIFAIVMAWPKWTTGAAIGAAVFITVGPWVWYYEIFARLKTTVVTWSDKFFGNLFHMNQFIIPAVVFIAAGVLFACKWRTIHPLPRQLILICLLVLPVSLVWVTTVAPWYFHRYIVLLNPLASLLMAWLFVEFGRWIARGRKTANEPIATAVLLSAIVVLCPLPSNLVSWMIPLDQLTNHPLGMLIRPELAVLNNELCKHQNDPNRTVIEWIKAKALPDDEILVNYEDIPFMFYTDNPIRGGVPCFRVEDRSSEPRFLVIRRSVPFMHWSVYKREIGRYRQELSQYKWKRIPLTAPDIPFGNNPDPDSLPIWYLSRNGQVLPDLILAERTINTPSVKN